LGGKNRGRAIILRLPAPGGVGPRLVKGLEPALNRGSCGRLQAEKWPTSGVSNPLRKKRLHRTSGSATRRWRGSMPRFFFFSEQSARSTGPVRFFCFFFFAINRRRAFLICKHRDSAAICQLERLAYRGRVVVQIVKTSAKARGPGSPVMVTGLEQGRPGSRCFRNPVAGRPSPSEVVGKKTTAHERGRNGASTMAAASAEAAGGSARRPEASTT